VNTEMFAEGLNRISRALGTGKGQGSTHPL